MLFLGAIVGLGICAIAGFALDWGINRSKATRSGRQYYRRCDNYSNRCGYRTSRCIEKYPE